MLNYCLLEKVSPAFHFFPSSPLFIDSDVRSRRPRNRRVYRQVSLWNGVPTKFMCVFLSIRANNYVPVKARLVHRKLRGGNFSMCCRWVKCKMYITLISHDSRNPTHAPIQRFQSSQRRSTPKAQSKRCSPCPYIPKCRNCLEFYT